jgi:predicted NBD/HSP70 family sugar kinase
LSQNDERTREVKLQWKDYLAITIASLQTVLLPIVLLLIVIIAFAVLFGIFSPH